MGACYYVELDRIPQDAMPAVAKALQEYIRQNNGVTAVFDAGHLAKLDGTLLPALGAVLPGLEEDEDGYTASFDASYGWEKVVMGAFRAIARHLPKGACIWIYPDSGWVKGTADAYGYAQWQYSVQ